MKRYSDALLNLFYCADAALLEGENFGIGEQQDALSSVQERNPFQRASKAVKSAIGTPRDVSTRV